MEVDMFSYWVIGLILFVLFINFIIKNKAIYEGLLIISGPCIIMYLFSAIVVNIYNTIFSMGFENPNNSWFSSPQSISMGWYAAIALFVLMIIYLVKSSDGAIEDGKELLKGTARLTIKALEGGAKMYEELSPDKKEIAKRISKNIGKEVLRKASRKRGKTGKLAQFILKVAK
jgi:hypothetical protein